MLKPWRIFSTYGDTLEIVLNSSILTQVFRIYSAVIVFGLRAARCLLLNRELFSTSPFATFSSASVKIISMWQGFDMYGLMRPWARYVRRRCLGAWLTWMCLTISLEVSRPLVSALASAFLRRPRRNSADLTGQRALDTPNCLPVEGDSLAAIVRTCVMSWSCVLLLSSTILDSIKRHH